MLTLLLLSGCATYGQRMQQMVDDVKIGNYSNAEQTLVDTIQPDSKEALLYHLERGSLQRLQGQFDASNQSLVEAERIASALETESVSQHLLALLSNPRFLDYKGERYERILIHYVKALNYLSLAQQAEHNPQQDALTELDNAGIEVRQLQLRLNRLRDEADSEDANDDSLTATLVKVYDALRASSIDQQALRYRSDAWMNYLAGVRYEIAGDWDDARISYQKAAEGYEKHFTAKLELAPQMAEQAWLDTLRMMRTDGDSNQRWKTLGKQHLSHLSAQLLDERTQPITKDEAQILVIEHKGLLPAREELNINVRSNDDLSSFTFQPYAIFEDRDGLDWFHALYADSGALGVIGAYSNARYSNVAPLGFTKNIFLGPLWRTIEDLGISAALANGMRVTVPYYRPHQTLPTSTLEVDNQTRPLWLASSPARLAIQELMLTSSDYLQWALVRATAKAVAAHQAAQLAGDDQGALALLGTIAGQLSESAETRSWLLLPAEIRIRRLRLSAGEHQLTLRSSFPNGVREHHGKFDLTPRALRLWLLDSPGSNKPIHQPTNKPTKAAASEASNTTAHRTSNTLTNSPNSGHTLSAKTTPTTSCAHTKGCSYNETTPIL